MDLHNTHSCVFQEISGISYGDPRDLMMRFCNLAITKGTRYHTLPANNGTLYPIYVFSAGVTLGQTDKNYGVRFAKFIRENKLGRVLGSPVRENKAFHPGRGGAVWIWMPDFKSLETWWKKNQKPATEAKSVK